MYLNQNTESKAKKVAVYDCVLRIMDENVGVSLSPYKERRAVLSDIAMMWACLYVHIRI